MGLLERPNRRTASGRADYGQQDEDQLSNSSAFEYHNGTTTAMEQNHEFLACSNSLPTYAEQGEDIRTLRHRLIAANLELPIVSFPDADSLGWITTQDQYASVLGQNIVRSFFDAVTTKKDEAVALMISCGLVTSETTDQQGRTPLLAAIEVGDIRMVQELVDFDANVNTFGAVGGGHGYQYKTMRTPLQLAAMEGNLTIVKLLMEAYHADDSLVAPDGELALRLASDNGHREIVDYLPSRRGGGWQRWKTKHMEAMHRAQRAISKIYRIGRFFVWDVPRFFLWMCPKHLIVLPTAECAKWVWNHREESVKWCKKQVVELPGRVACGLKIMWEVLKRAPVETWEVVKEIPSAINTIAKWLWKTTKSIPHAARAISLWLWEGIWIFGHSIASVIARAVSSLHTITCAVASLFRHLALKDILNGFYSILQAIFVEGPRNVWHWILRFKVVSFDVLGALFGNFGRVIWWIVEGFLWLVVYIPKKLWVIITSGGQSIAGALVEFLVWINPKR